MRVPNNPFNPIAAKTRLRVNGTLGGLGIVGTRLWLCALSEDTVQHLLKKPSLSTAVVGRVAKPPSPQSFSPAVRFVKRLLERKRAAVEGDNIDIDKAWHGIHFLLTGTAWAGDPPLNFILAGGSDISGGDGSTTRLYSPNEVREINGALACLDEGQLRSAYDPSAMLEHDIYPGIWQRDPRALDYCVDHFVALKKFVTSVRESGLGMVTKLS